MSSEEAFCAGLIKKIPSHVRIGAFDISIGTMNPHETMGKLRWGEFSSAEQAVRIQEHWPSRHKLIDTLMHEIMHGIYWAYGIGDDDKEERIVAAFASALVALYRDNPWLLDLVKTAKL